jgi:Cu(I)/Ag(I) efflux system membrane protein CusA/SilA
VKAKLETLKPGLPPGVEIVPTYDRSDLIKRAIDNLTDKLIEEFVVVALVCLVFLFHLRSAFVAIVSLPLGVLMAFIVMHYHGVNANIMSLGGIAIAIGAMVDAAVVMIENAHKHIEAWHRAHPQKKLDGAEQWRVVGDAAAQVGPALFLLALDHHALVRSRVHLEAQEGRLFSPLAVHQDLCDGRFRRARSDAHSGADGLPYSRPHPNEHANPINRALIALYRPVVSAVLRHPVVTLLAAVGVAALTVIPATRIGGEFMPPLDEGDLLYMPSALPGISAGKVSELLQQTDRMIMTVPEVARVFAKAGRAETATDPAPLEMFETTIQFKPREQWRAGMTPEKLVDELDRTVRVPGLANIWVPPIRNRIDMLATGIKSPVGIKVSGTDLSEIDRISAEVERAVSKVPGVTSAFAERLTGGRYIDVQIDRVAAARYGLNIADVQGVVSAAIGGDNVGETVEGLQRFPINVRYPREIRDSLENIRNLPFVTERGAQIRLGDVATIKVADGPPMLKSENARLSGWVYVDIRGRDLQSVVHDAQRTVAHDVKLAPGYTIAWSGQFEYLERASKRLAVVVPFTLMIIFVLLYLTFRRFGEALMIMVTVPFALIGGLWLMWLLDYHMSVASAVGFLALAGVAAEFGVIMLLYLRQALDASRAAGAVIDDRAVRAAIVEGAVLRVRPKAMTVAVILAGLLPIMWGDGTGSEVMRRIAAPMIGGMITAPILSMIVIPAAYLLMQRTRRRQHAFDQPAVSISPTGV